MGWLVIVGIFAGLAALGGLYLWVERTWAATAVFVLLCVPLASFARLAYLVLFTEDADPSVNEIALPFVLAALGVFLIWLWAYSHDPKTTTQVTDAATWTVLGIAATRKYQKMRDEERAKAVADELERRRR